MDRVLSQPIRPKHIAYGCIFLALAIASGFAHLSYLSQGRRLFSTTLPFADHVSVSIQDGSAKMCRIYEVSAMQVTEQEWFSTVSLPRQAWNRFGIEFSTEHPHGIGSTHDGMVFPGKAWWLVAPLELVAGILALPPIAVIVVWVTLHYRHRFRRTSQASIAFVAKPEQGC